MPTPAVVIAAAPTVPDPNDRGTFNARAYAFNAWETGELAPKVQQNATISQTNANEAAGSAATATAKAAEALASAAAAAAASNVTQWNAATNYATGACVFSPTTYITYRRKGPGGVNATDPAADSTRTHWEPISINGLQLRVVTGTAATAVNGELLAITNAGVTTVTAPANPAPGDRWGYVICNARADNVANGNGKSINGNGDPTMVIDYAYAHDEWVYVDNTSQWRFKV